MCVLTADSFEGRQLRNPQAQPETIVPSNSLMFMSGVSSGSLVLIVDLGTEEARTATCSRRPCNSPDDCSTSRPNGPASQNSLFGIRHSGTPKGDQGGNQEQDHHVSHFFSPALTSALSMEGHLMKIYAQNDHFSMVNCTISVER